MWLEGFFCQRGRLRMWLYAQQIGMNTAQDSDRYIAN